MSNPRFLVLLALLLSLPLVVRAGLVVGEPGQGRAAGPGTVLVAGASGRTGQLIVRMLADQGFEVRPLTTSASSARTRTGLDIDWLEVDVRDAAAVAAAMSGVDYVISAVGASEWRGANSPKYVDYGGVVNLVDAATAEGVRHFVLISSAAAGPHREHRDNPRRGYVLYWKTRGENHLRASGLDYTVLGPGRLADGDPDGHRGIVLQSRETYQRAKVVRADVARVAVEVLSQPHARNRSFAIVNDDGASRDQWRVQLREPWSRADTIRADSR